MIETIITCDRCAKDIKDNPAFTITSKILEINLRMDFCTHECMQDYLTDKWKDNECLI